MAIPEMDRAFAGMKADAGFDRVETLPAAGDIGFGCVCGEDADGRAVAGAGTKVSGVAVHSHAITGGGYSQFDAVSVMRRGLVWCPVVDAGDVTKNGAVQFSATGEVGDAAGTALPNAIFRSEAVSVEGGVIALVELHAPFEQAASGV